MIFFGPDLETLAGMGEQARRLGRADPRLPPGRDLLVADAAPAARAWWTARARRRSGLTVGEVADQAYYALKGGLTNEFYRLDNKRQFTILVRYRGDQRRDRADLEQVKIVGKKGEVVPLSSVARIEERRGPDARSSTTTSAASSRCSATTGRAGHRAWSSSMDLLMAAHEKIDFPPGYGVELRGDMTQMEESFQRLLRGLYLAVIFMFLLLVAQFRSLHRAVQHDLLAVADRAGYPRRALPGRTRRSRRSRSSRS